LPAHFLRRSPAFILLSLFLQRALHHAAQAGDPVFQQVIRRPVFHGLHRIFADGAGNEDEGNVQAAAARELRRS
jgi:hypothetical protein